MTYHPRSRKAMSQSMEIALIIGVVIAIVAVVAFAVNGGIHSLTQNASLEIAHSEFTKTFDGTYYAAVDVKNDGSKVLDNVTAQIGGSVPYNLSPSSLRPGQTASYSGIVVPSPANPPSGTQIPIIVRATADDGSITSKIGTLFAP
ncbi:MAG: hypothetical protein ACREA7_04955 [Nitrosotalea sp.]